MTTTTSLDRARSAYDDGRWADTYAAYGDLSPDDLPPADLEHRAIAAYMLGDVDAVACWEDAHRAAVPAGDIGLAVRSAFHLAFSAFYRGEAARGGGWLARAATLLDAAGGERVERGWLMVPQAIRAIDEGDNAGALAAFEAAAGIAAAFGDRDLDAMTRLGRGRALIGLGQMDRGRAFLDEAMVAVTTGAVTPMTMGQVYCGVIEACGEILDIGRAQEWTNALTAWCDRQSESVPYRGRCLVFRSELLTFHGDWTAAAAEAGEAHRRLAGPPPQPAVGEARYQQAEVHRLRGELPAAEAAYRQAAEAGRQPDPGLALLRLAQGRAHVAAAMIGRALDEALDPVRRLRLLGPLVEIALASGDLAMARAGADELAASTTAAGPPILATLAAWADGAVRLAGGDPAGALPPLRRAVRGWTELGAPYEVARARELVARACAAQGDHDAAAIERDAVRRTFSELGARIDLARLEGTAAGGPNATHGPLSGRELEILRGIAAGRTNREIAAALTISERTVDRHVSNIFAKLSVSSRSAATAWGYIHGLI